MGFALLARLDAGDRALFVRCVRGGHRSRRATTAWTFLTHLGGVECSVAAALFPFVARGTLAAAARPGITTLIVSHLIVQLIKRTVGRQRPAQRLHIDALVIEPDRFSFPSGHSAAAMSVAFVYSVVWPPAAIVLIPLAVLVGLSRVCLGVHYPGDVLIGQLIAVAVGVGVVT